MRRLVSMLCFSVALVAACAIDAPMPLRESLSSTDQNVTRRLRELAARTSYFATDDIIRNRWSERRWPPELLREQELLLAQLQSMRNDRDGLMAALGDSDPKVRTLALGALFVRDDPRDLPLIAAAQKDSQATFLYLHASPSSSLVPRPMEDFESKQSVRNVAVKMIRFYLDAAPQLDSFDAYWAARGARERSASWFLVKMRRATRRTTPLQAEYEADVSRVLAEINALPHPERAWTLLYVLCADTPLMGYKGDNRVTDSMLIKVLRDVGADSLRKFLRRETVSDDPDLRPTNGDVTGAGITSSMISFILENATYLLRPGAGPSRRLQN